MILPLESWIKPQLSSVALSLLYTAISPPPPHTHTKQKQTDFCPVKDFTDI